MASHRVSLLMAELSDEDLAALFQSGNEEALNTLVERYRRFARSKARGYFLVGADSDDVEQESLIGLFKAARDFRADRESSFRAFAELCITRQVITAIKTATRQKHQALNQYVSISAPRSSEESAERHVDNLLAKHCAPDPAEAVVSRDRMSRMSLSMSQMLSGLEVEVLQLYVEGHSYNEIGTVLHRHVKSVDNALQRIKRKLDVHLASEEAADLVSVA
jgi:RNA polymerase sporulation-specific sigma factor